MPSENSNDTVSEGIAYGMLIGVFMGDKSMFDTLWAFAQSKFNGNGLMTWQLDANGNPKGGGAATDADEDMAFALLMADKQWGGYANAAATLIDNIWTHEVDPSNALKPGDNFGGANETNPSYFAPAYYRAFAKVASAHPWQSLVDSSYTILAAATGADGLVPNWVNSGGVGIAGTTTDGSGPNFGYDACRTPWRIALDYCINGEPRAKTYLDKITAFYASVVSATGFVTSIKDGYTVTGTNPPGALGDYGAGMAFYGPATVGASASQNAMLLQSGSQALYTYMTGPNRTASGVFTYYHASWGLLSLMTLSGNFWDMSQ
ncbi:MAG TPA: glycosyl hydrolase family 8 [Polyangiaceae bacterium]